MVGLPGTGIGGIFYLINSIAIVFHETHLSTKGKSHRRRWIFVAKQSLMTGLILTMFWLTGMALKMVIPLNAIQNLSVSSGKQSLTLALIPFGTLAGVLLFTQFLRVYLWAKDRK